MRIRALTALSLLISLNAYAQNPPTGIQDEGGTISRPAYVLDCVGANVACTHSGTTGTITVSSDAHGDGANCSAGNYPLGVDASGAVQSCTADDDVPESGDFGNATDLDSDGSVSANAVALTTDTTGNYVSSATASQGLTLTGTEGASLGLQDCAANEVLKRNVGDTAWECSADSTGGTPTFTDITTGTNVSATMTVGTGASITTSGSGTVAATTAAALAANGGNCSAGSAPEGVDAAGAVENCTDYEEDLSNEAGLYAALSDVSDFVQTTETADLDFSGAQMEVYNSTTCLSTACDVAGEAGRICVDTDATSGQQFYVCEGATGWVLQGDGGGAEVNNLESVTTGILSGEMLVGSGANTAVYTAKSAINLSDFNDDLTHTTDTTCSSAACTVGADDTVSGAPITLDTGANPTADGQIRWDSTTERIEVGDDGVATLDFYSGAHTADEVGTLTTGDLCVNDGSSVNCTVNTEAELETALDATNVIVSTEIDAFSELQSLVSDKTLVNEEDAAAITADWDFGGGGIEIENGTTPPACTVGQLYLDTDATSGQQLMACEGGTFVVQGDGGGAETNNLETVTTGIASGEMLVGSGANTAVYTAQSSINLSSFNDDLSYITHAGEATIPNDTFISWRNAANTADVPVITLNTNDETEINVNNGDDLLFGWANGFIRWRFDQSGNLLVDESGGSNLTINVGTSDGTDNRNASFCPAGACNQGRGGYVVAHGNEYSGAGGMLDLFAGNVAGAYIRFGAAGTYQWQLDDSGNLADLLGNSIIFEGTTADGFETTLSAADPGADYTVTIPAETGTICTTGSVCTGYEGTLSDSAGLRGALSDESGTGAAIFAGGDIGAGTATTPAADDSDTSIATTAYVQGEINGAGGRSITCSSGTCAADAETYTVSVGAIGFEDPVATDDFAGFAYAFQSFTITGIYCKTDTGTVDLDINLDDGTPTGVNGSFITCTSSGVTDTTFAGDTGFASGEQMDLNIDSVASTPGELFVQVWGTADD